MIASQRRALRARAHALKPIVILGSQGLTPAVVSAIDEALRTHELIKIRLRGVERGDRSTLSAAIAVQAAAEVVNSIGFMLTLYRARPAAASTAGTAMRKGR
ncbi:MAG: YhbY family RNA-binding protein [Gammaproteobacteria bacterium]